jgi:hypothetical protein
MGIVSYAHFETETETENENENENENKVYLPNQQSCILKSYLLHCVC